MSYRSFRIDDILREDWNNGVSRASSGANNIRNTDTNETSGEFAHDTVDNLLEDDIEIEKQPHTRAGNHTHEVQHLQCGKKRESRKARTAFTDDQLRSLEQTFQKHKYLDSQHRVELSEEIGLTDLQVKTWYQNRRTKWKRQTLIEIQNCVRSYAMIKQVSPSFVKYDPIKAMVELNVDIIRANATMHSV